VHDIVSESIENARFVCEEHYAMFKGPPVQLICPKDLVFPYVPGHLYELSFDGRVRYIINSNSTRSHIVFELLKNSLRAVVERYGTSDESRLPPIKVIVVEGVSH
jgi:pyruvate dehydrogenase kinase 2/3/4